MRGVVIVAVLVLFLLHLQYEEGTACLYDARFSPDGTRFTTVDSHGCLSFFGLGKDYHYKKVLHNTSLYLRVCDRAYLHSSLRGTCAC